MRLKHFVIISAIFLIALPTVWAQDDLALIKDVPQTNRIDPSDEQDHYSFEGTAGERISLTSSAIDGSELDTVLELYNPNGQLTERNDDSANSRNSRIDTQLLLEGTYRAVVSSFGGASSGPYEILLQDAPNNGANDVLETREGGEVRVGTPVAGDLAAGDRHIWQLIEAEDQTVQLAVYSVYFDPVLEVYDDMGNLIDSNDDFSGYNSAIFGLSLEAGSSYQIHVIGFDTDESGHYVLETNETDPPPAPVALETETVTQSHVLPGMGTRFTFEGTADNAIDIAVSGDIDTTLVIFAPDGSEMAYDDDSGDNFSPLLEGVFLDETGTYIIEVSGYSASDTGDFSIIVQPSQPLDMSNATALTYGETVENVLADGDIALFVFDGQAGDVIDIQVNADFDGVLIVESAIGGRIARDDDGGDGVNPYIDDLILPDTGSYRIILETYGNLPAGDYLLSLRRDGQTDPASSPAQTEGGEVAYGDSVTSTLVVGGEARFTFDGTAGDQVTIEAVAEFDGYLELFDSNENLVTVDDDSGEGLNPLIADFELPTTDTFTILFRAFNNTSEGEFTLNLSAIATDSTPDETPAQQQLTDNITTGSLGEGETVSVTFDANAGDVFTIGAATQATDSELDLGLSIASPSGEVIAEDSDTGWRNNPVIRGLSLVESGTYTVTIISEAGAGDYTLAIYEGDVLLAPSGALAEPLTFVGSEAIVDVMLTAGESITYVLSTNAELPLIFGQDSEAFGVDVFTTDGIDQTLQDGRAYNLREGVDYFFVVYGDGDANGRISFTVDNTNAVVPETSNPADPLLLNTPITGSLGAGEVLTYAFTPSASGTFTFDLISQDPTNRYDPYIVLRDGNGAIIAEDDDQGGRFDARLAAVTLSGGDTVTVEVRSFADQSGGDFELRVAESNILASSAILDAGEILLDEARIETLNDANGQVEFALNLVADETVSLFVEGLTAPIVDIYQDETLVARGNAQILMQDLGAGTYAIRVYDRLGRMGEFTLSIRSEDAVE